MFQATSQGHRFQSTPPARGATTPTSGNDWSRIFQSTPPARGATCWRRGCGAIRPMISIHAPREGGDCSAAATRCSHVYFNPRPPRGGRLNGMPVGSAWFLFQSTPPARGATGISAGRFSPMPFQSTPPARGATTDALHHLVQNGNFNPRPPRGGRQQRCTVLSVDL